MMPRAEPLERVFDPSRKDTKWPQAQSKLIVNIFQQCCAWGLHNGSYVMYGLLDTTLDPKQTDPPHVMVARADEELAHAYEQITRAHEEIGRTEEQLSKLEHDAARHPSDHPQTRMNTFRPAVPSARPSLGRRAVRAFIGLTLTACIGVAAIAWQSPSYGNAAKQMIAEWAPQSVLTSSLPLEKPGLSALPAPPAVQEGAARAAPPQPAPPAQAASQGVAPTAAAVSAESAQLLQSMARDLATVGQRIEQLKASIDQLKVSQQQMSREIPKASESKSSEQNLRPKISSSPPRPTATSTRKPVPTLPSPQATAQPQAEKTQLSSAPRAPMR
jgi:hypothetical protein